MGVIKAEIQEDLNKLENQLQGINLQVGGAYDAAKMLESTVAQYGEQIKAIKDEVCSVI